MLMTSHDMKIIKQSQSEIHSHHCLVLDVQVSLPGASEFMSIEADSHRKYQCCFTPEKNCGYRVVCSVEQFGCPSHAVFLIVQ